MILQRFLVLTCVLLFATTPLSASRLKTWHVHSAGQHGDARFENTVMSDQGTIRLARLVKPLALAGINSSHIWDMVEDREGNLILATGTEGKILKVSKDGNVTTLHEHKGGPFLSLALTAEGTLYAGTGPDGLIVSISPRGEAKTLCETGEGYVWSLVYNAETKSIFAATGPKGRILKVALDGTSEIFLQTKQDHILCLAAGETGTLYAGTDKQGLIYRIDAKGKGHVLFQAPQGEIRSMLATPEALYVGTSAPTKKRGSATASATLTSLKDSTKDGERSTTRASTLTPPATGENSVYRIAPDGGVREIFRDKSQMLSLLKMNGKLLVGTGMDGRLFSVDEATREFAEIAKPDVGQIMRLVRRSDGSIALGTGDVGQVFTLSEGVAPKGTVLSEVFDAKLVSKWGAISWRTEVPKEGSVTVAVRGGNTSEPDANWSDWSPEFNDQAKASFHGPTCRFVQYRVTLRSTEGKSTPALFSVSLRYASVNQAPEVLTIESPDLDNGPLKDPKKLKIKWTATDPNEDDLAFDLFIRKDGWTDWARIEEAFGKTEYEWDTTTMPSGIYRMKVVASDRADNPEETALTGTKESAPIIVAHDAPRVTVKLVSIENGKATFEATATSSLARLASASYSLNGKRWINIFPTDGLFDGKEKTIRFHADVPTAGTYVLVLNVKDLAANTGTADVVFSVGK
ncbi:MAG: hypothetical protein K8T89_04950 [Planctomycetes bacterium]|nr:hypothetical protein [Planctomycetota bacterium]